MVVISSDNSNVGSGAYHKAGIDYLLAQNEDPSSIFYHKLSTRAGLAGHSQGGMGATAASTHPNVEAEVCVAGGGVVDPKVAFICLTGTADFVEGPCKTTYTSAQGPAFLADWQDGDHITTETVAGYLQKNPGTMQMQRLYAAWFRCFLADDQTACAMFTGSPCGICGDTGWATIEGRNL
jgi:pimeloyl-ACP methyl ester carboxylesterase